MDKESLKKRSAFVETVPALHRPALTRLWEQSAPKSRALAVKMKCMDCCCWQREEVRNCPAVTCALWDYRPFKVEGRRDG